MKENRTMRVEDVRDQANSLLLVMDIGARGAEVRDRTQRLLYALGDQTMAPPASPADAARLIASRAVVAGAMPKHIAQGFEAADMRRLKAAARRLGGKANLDTVSLG